MAIWVIKDGQREGPYEEQDVRELVFEGTYGDADPAIRDGQYDWSTVGQLLGREMPAFETTFSSAEALPMTEAPPQPAAELPVAEPEPPPIPAPLPEPVLPEPAVPAGPPVPAAVSIVDFHMPFGSMLIFILKWMFAWVIAMFILGVIAAVFWVACLAFLALLFRH